MLQEIKMRFGGDLEDVTERLEVAPDWTGLCVSNPAVLMTIFTF
jgi:hypothetical protein